MEIQIWGEDVGTILKTNESLGVELHTKQLMKLSSMHPCWQYKARFTYELVRKMRASFLVMGPLKAHKGKTKFHTYQLICAIGARPIDLFKSV